MAGRELFISFKELAAQLLRSTKARRKHPHVRFAHNAAIGSNCVFGEHVRIHANTRLADVALGNYCYVGQGSTLQHASVGNFCSIGPDVRIGLGVHPVDHVSTYPGFYSARDSGSVPFVQKTLVEEHPKIDIGSDVWIGAGAYIMDGTKIGHGVVVAAGAIVTKDVAPYTIVGGVPAKEIRKRFDDATIDALLQSLWWEKDDAFLRKHAESFRSPEHFLTVLRA